MMMLQIHTESGHPIFRASSALERGELRSKEHCEKSTHFHDGEENIELLLRTIISAVSTEHLQICARNYPKIQFARGNL